MDFTERLFQTHQQFVPIPSPQQVCSWLDGLLKLLFPELADRDYQQLDVFQQKFKENKVALQDILQVVEQDMSASAEAATIIFYKNLPSIYDILQKDANAILTGDPAALSKTEVIRTYPGFFAIAVYRLAHEFHKLNVPLVPRILTEHAHGRTGIDIHPAANIGERFCIDHGTGIVIGETVEIGTDVKIYQGVTLGALSVKKEFAKTKRHPTIEDRVIIYAGATILGGNTLIGHDSIIGGNVWIVKSVEPHSRIYYRQEQEFNGSTV